ncbi:hypothetical protein AWH56_008720 [Anaerobacillus isosaccharinicus]|uniref:Uncharacterized protein n=1 Tax=Anaerobacillus isosaccharinicus TaxID=1532552 RepID=A0A7S7LB29_9BACI|nr:hypothetical protein [Anaerobacillus isosaccharinicus]MBA5588944.1 hypothetical protein [Anaerobacillus isosaccharinicus]QOY37647.1 hypothetical protein AWH56_008720 [Anaerobacillus isosaccharinicus]
MKIISLVLSTVFFFVIPLMLTIFLTDRFERKKSFLPIKRNKKRQF